MKFTVASGEFNRVLSLIGAVIPSRSTLPILDNFLFELKKNELRISGTDLDTSMTITLAVEGSRDGKTLVPAKRLLETVRALPPTEVAFQAETDSRRIVLSTKSGEYRLTGEDLDAYPSLPNVEAGDHISLDDSAIRRLITKTSFAVSSDELRPAMMGVLFQFRSKEIRSIATDGHRLVRLVNAKLSSGKGERELVIPARALALILKSINGQQSRLSFSSTHVMFTHGNMTLVSRLIEEKYPNYESVIPLDNDKKLVVNKSELLSSVRRTSLYSSSTNHQVRLSLKKNSLTVSAEDIDFGSEAKETLSCEYSSEPLEIGFNASYIEGVLSQIDTEEVTIMLSSSTRASIISPSTQQEGEDLLMLVMPVRLNS
jgi:DNA polymerase-3 subunit beta